MQRIATATRVSARYSGRYPSYFYKQQESISWLLPTAMQHLTFFLVNGGILEKGHPDGRAIQSLSYATICSRPGIRRCGGLWDTHCSIGICSLGEWRKRYGTRRLVSSFQCR